MLPISGYGGREAEVVKVLEEDIIFGRLKPGERVTEDALLARFPVTRHFIRQALIQLEKLGVVVRERNKGATVRSFGADEVRQIYEVRELLQRHAALQIPLPAPAGLIDELEAIHRQYSAHVDRGYLRGVHEMNDAFHLTMFAAASNPYLVEGIEHYMRLTLPVRAKTLADRQKLLVSRRDHERMIEMLKGGDSQALAQLCVEHVWPSKTEYLTEIGAIAPPGRAA
jgi:DNA-binding GntR family transcriptional regulator